MNTISVPGIIELIRRNNNAKRPKIRFLVNGIEFVLSVASSTAAFPGSINVVSNRVWYGRIQLSGKYEPSQRVITSPEMLTALDLLAQDPAKAAADYGKQTGRCCFCGLGLDDHKSLEVGYGPICAKRYRLPWGNMSELEKVILVKPLTNEQAFG